MKDVRPYQWTKVQKKDLRETYRSRDRVTWGKNENDSPQNEKEERKR